MKRFKTASLTISSDKDYYQILMKGVTANVLLVLLFASITIILPILLLRPASSFYLSTPFYFTIVILYLCVLYLRKWGIAVAVITLIVSSFFLDVPKKIPGTVISIVVANIIINIVQVVLLYLTTKILQTPRKSNASLFYQKGAFYLSLYNTAIIVILVLYLFLPVFCSDIIGLLIILSSILFILTIIKACYEKDLILFKYTFLVALLPSALCSAVYLWICGATINDWVSWTLSNYIFLQTIGYIFFQLFYLRKAKPFKLDAIFTVNVSTAAYYLAIILLNALIIYLLFTRVIGDYGYIYFFPWLLGNVFLLSNFYFTKYDDASGVKEKEDRFKWFEKRIITIEKNTSGLITIISFILPLSVKILNNIPTALIVLFSANIFFACLSVGLIWIPNKNIRFISLLKTIKTISYTYSITLLLISAIMIMFLLLASR